MQKRLSLLAFLALVVPAVALSQTAVVQSPASLEVLRLAPQLVAFAGSEANFQSLVNGLAQGLPVTLVTATPDGFTQTASFTPSGTLAPLQVAQTLETARQQLISRGIATPSAQQIGVVLAGGSLPTAAGNVPVTGLVPLAAVQTSASAGATAPTPGSTGGLTVQTTPTAAATPPAASAPAAPVQFTSDSPRLGNTSDTPIAPASPVPATSAVPSTTAGTGGVRSNGSPSPAAQMQNRR